MLTIAEEYLSCHDTAIDAAVQLARDLMAGDPATFKAGYSLENAVIAACEAFGGSVSRDDLRAKVQARQ